MPATSFHNFHACSPILRVEDMARALDFYVGKLGYRKLDWAYDDFACVEREATSLYLALQGQGRGGAWVWIGVENADRLHDELVALGVTIRMSPTTFPWAREFQIEDPDGNVIRFGSDPAE